MSDRGFYRTEHATLILLIAALILSLLSPAAHASESYREAEIVPQGQPIPVKEHQQEPIKVVIVKPDPKPVNNRITFNPLGIILGAGSVNYERRLSNHVSLEVSPTFFYWGWDDSDTFGGGLSLGANFYVKPNAPRGLHFNISALGGDVNCDGDNTYVAGGRALVRYNWVWDSGFTLGLGGGVQYVHVGGDYVSGLNGVLPAVSFNIGYAW